MEICCGEFGYRRVLIAVSWSLAAPILLLVVAGITRPPQSQSDNCHVSWSTVIDLPARNMNSRSLEYNVPTKITSLVSQQAALNTTQIAQSVEQKLWPALGAPEIIGPDFFGQEDVVANLISAFEIKLRQFLAPLARRSKNSLVD